MFRSAGLLVIGLAASYLAIPDPVNPDPNGPRPIAAADTLFIEDMTWMEVRDAMKAGKEVDKLPLALPPVVAFVAVTVISEFIELIANMELNELP